MPRGFPVKKMKEIQEKIQNMDDDNQKSVLRIIQDDNIMYTENTNGVFFDIMTLQKDTLEKIMKLIEFCDNCNEYLSKREREQIDIKKDVETIDEENPRM
jgi:hypothetical protein